MKMNYKRLLFKRHILFALIFFLFFYLNSLFSTNISASGDGLTFEIDGYYEITQKLTELPNTIEAEIYVPKTIDDQAGVIIGNYGKSSTLNLEIHKYGEPRLVFSDKDGISKTYLFGKDIRGSWTHLVITHDKVNDMVGCYVDGELIDEMVYYDFKEDIINTNFVLGGDYRAGNSHYFKGSIRSVSFYSDVLTEQEVIHNMQNGVDLEDDNLMLHYQLSKDCHQSSINDLSNNGYDVMYREIWISEKEEITNYNYSFAVVGDTQYITDRYASELPKIYDWLLANQEAKNIAHVFGLGDITDRDSDREWKTAKDAISKLDNVIPYSLIRGNHDTSIQFNKTFNYTDYKKQFDGFYFEDKIDTSYRLFSVKGDDYLFVTLDYGATDEELNWAGKIIESYPEHKVIISTHAYLASDGTTLGHKEKDTPADVSDANDAPDKTYNSGDEMWEELISRYGNIFLVLCGHIDNKNILTTQSVGIHGNTVTQMLIDPQALDASGGAMGMIAMLYFMNDGNEIEVEYYSSVHQKFYMEENQFTIQLNEEMSAHNFGEWEIVKNPTSTEAGLKQKSCVCGKVIKENIESLGNAGDIEDNTNNDKSGCSGGCGGSIVTSLFGLCSLLGVAFYIKREKLPK